MSNYDIEKLAAEARKRQEETAEAKRLKDEQEKRQARLKKEAELKAKQPKPKQYYDVKVECMLPATLTYRVLAEDANQASELIKNIQPTSVKHKLIGRKEIKMQVYDAGSSMIRLVKNLFR